MFGRGMDSLDPWCWHGSNYDIGLALEDVIVANHVYELVRDRGDVRRLPLMEDEF